MERNNNNEEGFLAFFSADDDDDDDDDDDNDNDNGFNAYTPGAMQCPNFVMCGNWGVDWYFDCHGGRCRDCNMYLGENINILPEGADVEDCPVCASEGTARCKLPQCTHRFCGECTKKSLLENGECTKKSLLEKSNFKFFFLRRCPLCRVDTLEPAWYHTGRPDCRCSRRGCQQGAA
jgi:hypothetical protein